MEKIKNKYLSILLMICMVVPVFFGCLSKGKKQMDVAAASEEGFIFNMPADGLVLLSEWGADIDSINKEQAINALKRHVDSYANTQIRRMFFNVNYLRSCYDSKVMTTYWDVPDPATSLSQGPEWQREYWQLYKKGIDAFEVCISQSRVRNISPWLSFRMNDHHYRDTPRCLSKLMLEHPELRISPTESFDYSKKEVREYYKAYIKEALEKYDVDGIEIDWLRTYNLFKPGMESEGVGIINGFMKEIKSIVDQNANKRGHAIEIAARVPVTPEIGEAFGLDGVTWVKNGLVDILIPANFHYPTSFDIPVEQWKKEIGETTKPYIIAPCAETGIQCCWRSLKIMHNSIETIRAFSISAYDRGADAIYLFNYFYSNAFKKKIVKPDGSSFIVDDKQTILEEGGKLSSIVNKPRRHILTYTKPDITGGVDAVLPKKIAKGDSCTVKIYTGPKPSKDIFIVRIGIQSLEGFHDAKFTVKINNCIAEPIQDLPKDSSFVYKPELDDKTKRFEVVKNVSEVAARLIQFKADPKSVKNGYNNITVSSKQSNEQQIIWMEVYVE